jgi:hypothetical protein
MSNKAGTEHDFSANSWGNSYSVSKVRDGGMSISLYGWRYGIEEGDFLILPNKMETTRYRVASIRYENDPRDMWFAEAEFAPRPFEEEE